jgi:hypothetical protein
MREATKSSEIYRTSSNSPGLNQQTENNGSTGEIRQAPADVADWLEVMLKQLFN